jgi:hypothetical protein
MSSELWENKQSVGETMESFVNMMRKKVTIANAQPDIVINATIHGLCSDIKTAISHHKNLDSGWDNTLGICGGALSCRNKKQRKLETTDDH